MTDVPVRIEEERGVVSVTMSSGANALSEQELDVVRLWISYGAPND